tara:strand:+ start:70 stop:297 length:228 start_codon:yes stop_codon:yes gene_type:complete|eukprot:scaffold70217_cov36-Phaeocystis_antarctica.AAC.1
MSGDEESDRFYLVEDLLRKRAPSGTSAEEWEAQLDERGEELAAFELHAGLYQAHLLRKSLSGTILSTLLEEAGHV